PGVEVGKSAVFVIETSAGAGVTGVEVPAELSPGSGSVVVELTVTVFVIGLTAFTSTLKTKVSTCDAPAASVPTLQVVEPHVDDTNVVPAGVVSLTTTFDEFEGPSFVTVTVYVMFVDAVTV